MSHTGETHLLIVSESPHTQRCRLGRVMATTIQSKHTVRPLIPRNPDRTYRSTVASPPEIRLRAPYCSVPD